MPHPRSLWLGLDRIADQVRAAGRLLVAVDFDGTLTPIVAHPDEAKLSARTRRVLGKLARLPGVDLAVISGRALADVRRRVGIPRIHYAGSAGLETLGKGGRRELHVPVGRRFAEDTVRAARDWCARFPGGWVEEKPVSLAIHYRNVPARHHHAFIEGVRRRWRGRPKVDLIHGKMVFDLMPAVRWNKASALRRFWNERRDVLVWYFGDDAHDEPVHQWVRRQGGISVAVGRLVSRAEYVLPAPADVLWVLEWLEREWRQRPGRNGRRRLARRSTLATSRARTRRSRATPASR